MPRLSPIACRMPPSFPYSQKRGQPLPLSLQLCPKTCKDSPEEHRSLHVSLPYTICRLTSRHAQPTVGLHFWRSRKTGDGGLPGWYAFDTYSVKH